MGCSEARGQIITAIRQENYPAVLRVPVRFREEILVDGHKVEINYSRREWED